MPMLVTEIVYNAYFSLSFVPQVANISSKTRERAHNCTKHACDDAAALTDANPSVAMLANTTEALT